MKDTTKKGDRAIEYTLRVKQLTEAETMRQNRIFISYKREDEERVRAMDAKMRQAGLEPIWDQAIDGGDFKKKIEKMLRCRAAVILISEAALRAPWVEYELGFLEGRGTKVFFWDPDEILSGERAGEPPRLASLLKNVHLFRHMPAITGEERLIAQLKHYRMYAGLRSVELPDPDAERELSFGRRFDERVETVALKLDCPQLSGRADLLRDCKLGTLLVNFGCFPRPREKAIVGCPVLGADALFPEAELLAGRPVCRKDRELACARYGIRQALDKENAECLLLNHIEWSGRFEEEDGPRFSFYIPVHSRFGTTFKPVIDPPNERVQWELVSLLEKSGLSPTVSDSHNSLRIYLSLREDPQNALFCLKRHYQNNFCCPAILRIARK